jgi:cytochrome c oxidase assembly factor CtaG
MAAVTLLPFALWFTGWYAASLRHAWVYGLTHLVVLGVGFAFFGPILGADDDRRRLPWAAATAVVFVETVLDALPGIAVWLRGSVLAPSYWLNVNRPWGRTPLADQKLGGLVFWGIGEVIGLPLLLITVIRWMHADAAEAARIDADLDAQETATPWWQVHPSDPR